MNALASSSVVTTLTHEEERGRPSVSDQSQRPRKRAKLVCHRCHEKKIKCDLDVRRGDENKPCMNCEQSKEECRLRPSLRNAWGRGKSKAQARRVSNAMSAQSDPIEVDNMTGEVIVHCSDPETIQLRPTTSPVQLDLQGQSESQVAVQGVEWPEHPVSPSIQPPHIYLNQASTEMHNNAGVLNEEQVVRPPTSTIDDGGVNISPGQAPPASYLGESGYMPFLSQEQGDTSARQGGSTVIDIQYVIDPLQPLVRKTYVDAFLRHCYTFCPVLDHVLLDHAEFGDSLLLHNAIGLVGSVIQPSLLHKDAPASYYSRAKALIHINYESNPLATLIAVMLFYWWSLTPPNIVSMDTVWWWSGIAIRQAQELGLHHEPKQDQNLRSGETTGLRRRVWWTLFARERLTAICQGRPCIINARDCDVHEPTPEDFPKPLNSKAMIFIHWIRLCSIVGRVGDHLRWNPGKMHLPYDLLDELKQWVNALPESLRLPFATTVTPKFDPDLYQLHLPYLSCITLLHMKKSNQGIQTAHTLALLAASCTARIFEEFLINGSLRQFQGMAGWYAAIALLALMDIRQARKFKEVTDAHIKVLQRALQDMAERWGSAKMYYRSIEKLLVAQQSTDNLATFHTQAAANEASLSGGPSVGESEPVLIGKQDWFVYFPGTSSETSPLFSILLAAEEPTLSEFDFENGLSHLLYDIFDNPFDGGNLNTADHILNWGMTSVYP